MTTPLTPCSVKKKESQLTISCSLTSPSIERKLSKEFEKYAKVFEIFFFFVCVVSNGELAGEETGAWRCTSYLC